MISVLETEKSVVHQHKCLGNGRWSCVAKAYVRIKKWMYLEENGATVSLNCCIAFGIIGA